MAKKLFQHVAKEQEKKGAWEKIRLETLKVFKGGESGPLCGLKRTYTPNTEGGTQHPPEEKELVTTVTDRLAWQEKFWAELVDFEYNKDLGNQKATGTISYEGTTIQNVPVTTLLTLDKMLKALRETIDHAPTLDISRKWIAIDKGKWSHGPDIKLQQQKKTVPLIMAPATKEHPAQVKEVTEDVTVGHWETVILSGALTPAQKSNLLTRIDGLIEACKDARMQANDLILSAEEKIGKRILDLITSQTQA